MTTMQDQQGQDLAAGQSPSPTTTTTTLQLVSGLPVFDANGHRLGTVDDPPIANGGLILRKGHIFPKDVASPLMAVRSADASGVYLTMAKDDVQQERWDALANLPATDPGIVMRGTTVLDTDEHVMMRGTTVIDTHPHAGEVTRGTTVVDHEASEMTRGTTARDTRRGRDQPSGGAPGGEVSATSDSDPGAGR